MRGLPVGMGGEGLRGLWGVLSVRHCLLDSRVRGNDGVGVGPFHPFVTPAKAGVHRACGFGGWF